MDSTPALSNPGMPFLEAVPCPLCGGWRHRRLLAKQGHFYVNGEARQHTFSFVRCRDCGLDHVNPRLRSDLIAHHYSQHDLYVDLRGAQLEARRAYFRQTLESLRREERKGGRVGVGNRLLDVACAEGTFVALALEEGWQAEGIEISAPAAAHARDILGLPVRTGTLEEAALEAGAYDVITLQSFLEHSEAPRPLLGEVLRLLAPGGLLYLNVCNGRSLAARLEKVAWYNYDPVVHLNYFGPGTLARLATDAGFHHIKTRSRGVGARFFQTAVADTAASRRLDDWYHRRGHASSLLILLKRWASAGLSAAGLGQTLVLTARKPGGGPVPRRP